MYKEIQAANVAAVNAAKKVTAATMLADMETQRIALDTAAKRVSTVELYSLLAECLRFCKLFQGKDCDKLLAKFYAERDLKFKAKAKLTTKVIHAVFGDVDRRRVNTYAIVVKKLMENNVAYYEVAAWIAEQGGINAIKNANSSNASKGVASKGKGNLAEDKIKLVTDFIKDEQLAVIDDAKLLNAITADELSVETDVNAQSDEASKKCVLIAEINADGHLAVRALVRKDAAINTVLMAYYNDNKAIFENATASAEVEDDDIEVSDWFYTEELTDVVDATNDEMEDAMEMVA